MPNRSETAGEFTGMTSTMKCILASRIHYGVSVAPEFTLVARTCMMAALRSMPAELPIIAPRRPEEIALTFDEGPDAGITPRIVDMLTIRGIRATFFLFGQAAHEEPYLTRYIVDCGHVVGSHTWTPSPTRFHSFHHLRENLYRSRNTLEQITGKSVRYFRPPSGSRRPAVITAARAENMISVLWNVKAPDWPTGSPERAYRQLYARIDATRANFRAANVALQHGGLLAQRAAQDPSIESLRRVVERYRVVRRFVTLDRWCEQ